MSDDIFNNVYNKSLDLLSRREHSIKEIKEKLLLRFDDKEVVNSVITKLKENNLVNNERFAGAYVSNRKRKGFGPKKIFYELLSKGVNESVIETIISEEGGWKKTAKLAFMKKFKDGPSSDTKQILKQKHENRLFRLYVFLPARLNHIQSWAQ